MLKRLLRDLVDAVLLAVIVSNALGLWWRRHLDRLSHDVDRWYDCG